MGAAAASSRSTAPSSTRRKHLMPQDVVLASWQRYTNVIELDLFFGARCGGAVGGGACKPSAFLNSCCCLGNVDNQGHPVPFARIWQAAPWQLHPVMKSKLVARGLESDDASVRGIACSGQCGNGVIFPRPTHRPQWRPFYSKSMGAGQRPNSTTVPMACWRCRRVQIPRKKVGLR